MNSRVLLDDVVHMHDVLWEGLEADMGVGVLWQGACACQHSYLVYDLDGYAHSGQSDVTSVSNMVDYV